ncbi:MAG TPA: signal peptide peptidase SppA [Verrucomicrobiae bacterium]|jgi:protease-4|nr:signal peptide peptidase SppA [Verrucomicrobiae bacterium]
MDDQSPPMETADAPPISPPPPPPVAPPPIIPPSPAPRGRSGTIWKALAVVFIVLFIVSLLTNFLNISRNVIPRSRAASERERGLEEVVTQHTNSDNKIAVIQVDGVISGAQIDGSDMTLVDFINEQLKMAAHDNDVKAVILKVNSPGGEVMASDQINQAITRFQDSSHKPVVVSMESLAASGGYYISVPCRWIVADELTITGSIGVIMHGYNYRLLMDKVGVTPHVYKSGRFKDMLSGEQEPDPAKLSEEDRRTHDLEDQMVQSLIDETFAKFKDVVKTGRERAASLNGGKGKALVDDWADYADGRVLSGKQALAFGFVDELGDFDTAVSRAENIAGISSANLVEYRIQFDLGSVLSRFFGKTEVPAIKVDLGMDLPKLQAGRLYFITPMTVLH